MKALMSRENKRDIIVALKILSPVFFLIFIFVKFQDFVIHAIKAEMAVNMGIIFTAFYGAVLILIRLRSAQIDFRVLERFGREVNKGANMKDLLEQPWIKKVYVRHYLNHIANTGGTLASQIDQNAIENELHALQNEYNHRLELPQFVVGFMIALGLLGTFIGLLNTLTGISGMLDGMGGQGTNVEEQFGKLVVELRKPLAGMGIAFSASMFGLIGSLMLAIMMINLRRFVGKVISLARNVMHDLTVIVSNTTPTQQVSAKGGDSAFAASVSSTTLAGRLDLLTRKIESVLEAFETSINSTQRMVDLMSFGPRMKEISERTLDEMKMVTVKSAENQKLLQDLIVVSGDAVKMSRSMIEVQQQTKETGDEMLQTVKSLAGADIFFSQRRDQEFRDRLLTELKSLITLQSDHKKLTQSAIDLSGNHLRGLDTLAQTQKDGRAEVASLFGKMIESLQKSEEVQIGGARHLYDIKERLIKVGNNMNIMDLIASSISGHTVLLETLVEEARVARTGEMQQVPPDFPPDGNEPQQY